MSREEMLRSLSNVLVTLETVSAQGEANWNALLASKQEIRKVCRAMEEEHENNDEQRKNV